MNRNAKTEKKFRAQQALFKHYEEQQKRAKSFHILAHELQRKGKK